MPASDMNKNKIIYNSQIPAALASIYIFRSSYDQNESKYSSDSDAQLGECSSSKQGALASVPKAILRQLS